MGVAMLPRLAATVSTTTRVSTRSSRPSIRNTSRVKGTKVMRVTSLVITMLQKKHSSTSTADRLRRLPARRSRVWPSRSNTPRERKPATTTIRQNSRARVR